MHRPSGASLSSYYDGKQLFGYSNKRDFVFVCELFCLFKYTLNSTCLEYTKDVRDTPRRMQFYCRMLQLITDLKFRISSGSLLS